MVTELTEHGPAEASFFLAHGPRERRRVLVVDDDPVIRQLIAANLTLEGFDVVMAADGQECLDNVLAIAPDIIALDVAASRIGNKETALRLRTSPETAHIKLVLITARTQEDDLSPGPQVDADAYVTKPFDAGTLIRAIRALAEVSSPSLGRQPGEAIVPGFSHATG